jgi:hypothetical protein
VRGHDRALHQYVPFPGEGIGVADSRLGGDGLDIAADVRQVIDGGLVDRILPVINLYESGQERAALKIRLAEPLGECVEDRQ